MYPPIVSETPRRRHALRFVKSGPAFSQDTANSPPRPASCRAAVGRALRALVPCLLLALAGLATAQAQAQTAYVANNDVRLTNAGYGVSSSSWQAQRFGTGSQASIPLGGIGLTFRQGRTNLTGLVVRIYTVSGGAPGTVVYTLTNPDTLTANTEALFEAPANAELEADTDYFVVVEPTGTFSANWASTSGGAEDSGVTAGWSIADDHYFRAGSGGSWGSSNDALAMAAYPPADATRLVSNLDQSVNNPTTVGSGAGEAQSFATGSHAGGYNLDGVVVKMAGVGAGDTPVVSVYDDNSGVPGTLVHSLTNPSPLPSGSSVADTEFTAAANATLDADSTYWVVIESSAGDFQVGQTTSHAEDSGKAAGWSVGDTKLWRTSSQTWDDSTSDTTAGRCRTRHGAQDRGQGQRSLRFCFHRRHPERPDAGGRLRRFGDYDQPRVRLGHDQLHRERRQRRGPGDRRGDGER